MARHYDVTRDPDFVYDPRQGHFIDKRLARTAGGGHRVAVDGRYSAQADDRQGNPPADTTTPGWHVCVGCRGSGSCPNCGGLGVVGGDVECSYCGGSGDCRDCAGKGRVWGRPVSPAVSRAAEKLLDKIRRVYGVRL
jgi:hypothetical protein